MIDGGIKRESGWREAPLHERQKKSDDLLRANYAERAKHEAVCAARLGISREQYLERWRRLLASPEHSQHIVQFKGSDRSPGNSDKT